MSSPCLCVRACVYVCVNMTLDLSPLSHGRYVTPAGERCELVKDVCQSNLQCQNGGSCVDGQCVCEPGFAGLTCEERKY